MPEVAKWQMVAWAVAAALVVFAAARMLGARGSGPDPPPVRIDGGAGARSSPAAASGGAAGASGRLAKGDLYVHVAGAVRHPGLFRVPAGARVAAAVDRAGGPARGADLAGVNLAQPLEDGQQVIVPRLGAGAVAGSASGAAGGAAGGGVTAGAGGAAGAGGPAGASTPSLATATVQQLDGLDGIGPALAQRIVDYRESHGGFHSLGELREVEGIGEKRFAALRKALRP